MTADRLDPKTLWQEQEQETDPVTLERIHTIARTMDRKTRYTPPIIALTLVAVGVLAAMLWNGAHSLLDRIDVVLFVAGQLGCYFMIYRVMFPARDPSEPAGAYLRRRVVRSLSYQQGGIALALLPLAPFLLLSGYRVLRVGHGPLWARTTPFALVAVILAWVFVRASSNARRTRAQLRELDELMKS